jgi:phage terminase large subunit-like protein
MAVKKSEASDRATFSPLGPIGGIHQLMDTLSKGLGNAAHPDLVETDLSHVTRYQPDGDKIMRLHAQMAMIENGFVHRPGKAHWLADYALSG